MAERLREVPKQRPRPGIDLLGKQAQVIRRLGVRDEDLLGFVDLTRHREGLGQPESAKDEGALLPADTVPRSGYWLPEELAAVMMRPRGR